MRLLLSILSVLLVPGAAQAAHYRLFVLTGQSNSLGTTAGGETDPSSGGDPADAHVKFFWRNYNSATPVAQLIGDSGGAFTTLRDQQGGAYAGSASHWGPEIHFARTLYRAGVRDFGVIKVSRGGGGNSLWSKTASDHHMYTHVVETVSAATATLTSQGDTFEIAGLLYLQGESDSAAEAELAGARLKELTDNLRADFPNATGLHCIAGGIAAAGSTRDIVRARQSAIAAATGYIDAFGSLDLQPKLYDGLHFNKAAKITVGERFAQAFFSAGVVARRYGKLVFIGDSITQGGNGDHPGYRYTVFKHLANRGVPIHAATGYKFTGSVTGPYANSALTTPAVNGQTFENVHDGHYGWRASWECARVPLPAGRYNTNNLGQGTLPNWTGQAATFATANAGTLNYTGTTYVPDTAVIMIGINDLADYITTSGQTPAVAGARVRDDIATMIDQLRAANPAVRIHVNRVLFTNQSQAMKNGVTALNALLPDLVAAKNAASAASPVWLVDAATGFDPVTLTYDNIHPNTAGETYVGDRIAAALGLLETPATAAVPGEPVHIEAGSEGFSHLFEGNAIWNGSSYPGASWKQSGTLAKTISGTDLRMSVTGSGASWLEGTDSGWKTGNSGSWTFEARLKFHANPAGFILWLGTGTRTILVEIHGDHTQDLGGNSFNAAHDNLDGQFHVFRVTHDAVNGVYHVWRDGVRLTPLAGAPYDNANAESRLILGDYTSGAFGNNFDVTLDHVRFDFSARLPTGADADGDGMPDTWEYLHYGSLVAAVAGADEDSDGRTNLDEYRADTNPRDASSALRLECVPPDGENPGLIRLNTSAQRAYTLYRSTDLGVEVPWVVVTGPVAGVDGPLSFSAPVIAPRVFYKVGVSMP